MTIALVIAGVFFVAAGAWAALHPMRSPDDAAAGWLSTPSGRDVGGVVAVVLGAAVILSVLVLR